MSRTETIRDHFPSESSMVGRAQTFTGSELITPNPSDNPYNFFQSTGRDTVYTGNGGNSTLFFKIGVSEVLIWFGNCSSSSKTNDMVKTRSTT